MPGSGSRTCSSWPSRATCTERESPMSVGNEPLRIAEVPAGAGTIGVTFCPGKQGAGHGGTLHARSVEADVDAIRRWGASAVVTLIESHEFELLQVTAL